MKTSRKQFNGKVLVSTLTLAMMGLGLAGNAQATAYSYAYTELQNFTIYWYNANGTAPTVDPAENQNNRTTSTSAVYPPPPSGGDVNTVTTPANSDALQATDGPGAFPGENTFKPYWGSSLGSPNPTPVIGQGARADALTNAAGNSALTQAATKFDPTTAPAPTGGVTSVKSVSESSVSSKTTATEFANNTANIQLSITADTSFLFGMKGIYDLFASTNLNGEVANAGASATFDIYRILANGDLDLVLPEYKPFEVTCAAANGSICNDPLKSNGAADNGLTSGTGGAVFYSGWYDLVFDANTGLNDYQFSLRLESTGNETSIPEPASMLLLGTGLLGLAASRRRKLAVV